MLQVFILSAMSIIYQTATAEGGQVMLSAPSTGAFEFSRNGGEILLAQAVPDVTSPTMPAAPVTPGFDETKCRRIADLSSPSRPVFTEKPDGEWECSYQLEYSETGHKPSVFLQIRGFEPGAWSSFRVKLNFGSLLSRQVLGDRAASLTYALIGDETPMRELAVTLGAGREFEASFGGITLRYRKERFNESRFNLSGARVPTKPLPAAVPAPAPAAQ